MPRRPSAATRSSSAAPHLPAAPRSRALRWHGSPAGSDFPCRSAPTASQSGSWFPGRWSFPPAASPCEALLDLGGKRGTALLTVTAGVPRPRLSGSIAYDVIDLAPYLPAAVVADRGEGGSIWSPVPLSAGILPQFDGSVTLTGRQLRLGSIESAGATLSLRLADRVLRADLEGELYGGRIKAALVSDAERRRPIDLRMEGSGIAAEPLARAAFGEDAVSGTLGFGVQIAASGSSPRDLAANLGGRAHFSLERGALPGRSVRELIRLAGSAVVNGWPARGEQGTRFDGLRAEFVIAEGMVLGRDLRLRGPEAWIEGQGQIDLPRGRIAAKLDAYALIPAPRGAGGPRRVGLSVPIVVSGAWDAPAFYPDLDGVLTDPARAFQRLREQTDLSAIGGFAGAPDETAVRRP